MSGAKHTPGPWSWGENYNGLYGSGPESEVLTYATYEGMWLSHVDQREANARLIAAAPDLLTTASAILKLAIENKYGKEEELRALVADIASMSSAAIAKATGSAT